MSNAMQGLKVTLAIRAPASHLEGLQKGELIKVISSGMGYIGEESDRLWDLVKLVDRESREGYRLDTPGPLKQTSTVVPAELALKMRELYARFNLGQEWLIRLFLCAYHNGHIKIA